MSLKKIITTMMALYMVSAFAADNKIYIDQIGDNSTITMTQDGAGNTVKGPGVASDDNARIYGNGATVLVEQIGSSNLLKLVLNAGNLGNNNSLTYTMQGNNSTANISCDASGGKTCDNNTISVVQGTSGNTADGSSATVTINGSQNTLNTTQYGGVNQVVLASITGSNTSTTVNMTGGAGNEFTYTAGATTAVVAATNSIITSGTGNKVTLTQDGGTGSGHSTTIDGSAGGSNNTFDITQAGTNGNSIVSIKSSGSGNTFTVNSNTK
jgi:hypothetical protein